MGCCGQTELLTALHKDLPALPLGRATGASWKSSEGLRPSLMAVT